MSAELPSYTVCVVLAASSNSLRPYHTFISSSTVAAAIKLKQKKQNKHPEKANLSKG